MKRHWKDISNAEKAALANAGMNGASAGWIGILPLAATEQHGNHLPVETDSLIVAGIIERLAKRLPPDARVTFLPVEETGYSPEHMDFAGSTSLSYDAAINQWIGIGAELNSCGIRKIILLNAHGGNSPLMTIVATELRIKFSMLAVATSWTRFAAPAGLIDSDEIAYGIHGGEIETSVMLALHPEKIHLENLAIYPNFQEELVNKNRFLRAYGKHAFGWKIQDLNPDGVVGNATKANAEKGEKLLDHSVNGLLHLIREVEQFDISYFDQADHRAKMDKLKK